jgi:hypothetical protein
LSFCNTWWQMGLKQRKGRWSKVMDIGINRKCRTAITKITNDYLNQNS